MLAPQPEETDFMPNDTQNVLTFTGPDAELVLIRKLLQGDETALDFNKVVPMPPILARVVSPVRRGDNGRVMLNGSDPAKPFASVEATEEEQAEFDAAQDSAPRSRYGLSDEGISWYEWSTHHWGTKWNAYEVEGEQSPGCLVYRFQTAWDAPRAFYEALVAKVREVAPNVETEATAQFEDDGYEREETLLAA